MASTCASVLPPAAAQANPHYHLNDVDGHEKEARSKILYRVHTVIFCHFEGQTV